MHKPINEFVWNEYLSLLLFISLVPPGLSCSRWNLWLQHANSLVENLFPQPGVEPVPSALAAWSLSQWTTREVPSICHFYVGVMSSRLKLTGLSVVFKSISEKEGGKGNQKRLGPVPTCDPLSLKVYLWKRGAVISAVAQTNQTAFTSISVLQENQTKHSDQGSSCLFSWWSSAREGFSCMSLSKRWLLLSHLACIYHQRVL